jgi:hypothetical protein
VTALPTMLERIVGRNASGVTLAPVRCALQGAVRRTIGVSGGADDVVVIVPSAEWPPANLDRDGLFDLTFGDTADSITLGGYRLREERAAAFGVSIPVPDPVVTTERLTELRFSTRLDAMADGRGGVIRDKTRNRLKADGTVDALHADFKTNSELATIALNAIGMAYDAPPTTLNDVDPPGPLDWGNAPALAELTRLLAYCGHALVLNNAGDRLSIVRLPLPGEEVDIPAPVISGALPHALRQGPSMKARKIVVSSGRTRSIIVTSLDGTLLEWVRLDTRTGRWMNGTEWAAAYGSEIRPDSITELRKGPPTDATLRQDWNAIFSAVRIVASEREKRGRLVELPREVTLQDGRKFGGAACVVYARVAVPLGNDQLRNWPLNDGDAMVRIDGASPVGGEGVIRLPGGVVFARHASGQNIGGYADLSALPTGFFALIIAHEANTGDHTRDYFHVGYSAAMSGGAVALTELSASELDDALEDPTTLVIVKEDLQRVMTWRIGQASPDADNIADLKAIALKLAKLRAAGDYAQSGEIPFATLREFEPGAHDGVVSQVVWDPRGRTTTMVINEHHVPDGVIDELSADAGYSLASGLARLSPPGSSVSLSDVKQMTAPAAEAWAGVNAVGSAITRGAEKVMSWIVPDAGSVGPRLRDEPTINRFFARITGNTGIGGAGSNRWSYQWQEVRRSGVNAWTTVSGGRTHSTSGYGLAYNLLEAGNAASGVQGNGVTIANLPAGFTIRPIGNSAVVEIITVVPNGSGGFEAYFAAPNAVDGSCPS